MWGAGGLANLAALAVICLSALEVIYTKLMLWKGMDSLA